MTHNDARKILEKADAQVILDEKEGLAKINGELNIDELHAILQLLEYSA